jgi:hypothetical protein
MSLSLNSGDWRDLGLGSFSKLVEFLIILERVDVLDGLLKGHLSMAGFLHLNFFEFLI